MLSIAVLVGGLIFAVMVVRKLTDIDNRLEQLLAEQEN